MVDYPTMELPFHTGHVFPAPTDLELMQTQQSLDSIVITFHGIGFTHDAEHAEKDGRMYWVSSDGKVTLEVRISDNVITKVLSGWRIRRH